MATKPTLAFLMHPVVQHELFRPDHIDAISRATHLLSRNAFRSFEAIKPLLDQTEVLMTSWGCPKIDQALIARAPRLQLIIHVAGSIKGVVDDTVFRRGVKVTNAVAANAVPVAEYTLAAILATNKRLLSLSAMYRKHQDDRSPQSKDTQDAGNYRKVVGIVGASSVGRKVIELLQPFDYEVLLYDPFTTAREATMMGCRKTGLTELLRVSDTVSLHAPLLPTSIEMIGARELASMKNHATLINTARGKLIDQAALERELVNGRICAVLDTTTPEPLPPNHPFYRLPNVLLTPHIAGSLGRETQRLADYMVDELQRFCDRKPLSYQIKYEELSRLA